MTAEDRHYEALGLVRFERAQPETPQATASVGTSAAAPVVAASLPEPPTPALPAVPESSDPSSERPVPPEDTVNKPELDPERLAHIARMDWDTLRSELARRTRPPATQGVFGVGNPAASLFVVGEAPGAEEDRQGEPFVGRAGKLLDAMLGAIGRSRGENVYIANICKFRPPDNRDPRPEEVAEDFPLLLRQIALVKPKLLLAVGRIAAQTLLESNVPIGRLRGSVHNHEPSGVPLIVTYHPAYLLRSPLQKAKAWDDLKRARNFLRDAEDHSDS